jgi:hypothetical protein
MGNKRQGSASKLFRFTHSGFHHSYRIVQWRGDVRSFQEPPPYGNYNLQVSNKIQNKKEIIMLV